MASDCTNQHGCVIVSAGRVVSIGHNKYRNHPSAFGEEYEGRGATTHAESDSLSRVTSVVGAVAYVARVDKYGSERFSLPCEQCAWALTEAGIKRVVFTEGEL